MPCLTQVLTRHPVGDDGIRLGGSNGSLFERGLQLVEGGARLRAIGARARRGQRLNGGLQTQSPAPTGAGTIPSSFRNARIFSCDAGRGDTIGSR